MIRAIIFDFNGVIVDDEPLHFELFRDLLGGLGIELSEDDYYSTYVGFDDRGAFEEALRRAGRLEHGETIDDLIDRKAELYLERAPQRVRFFPGVEECVRALAARWPLAINSGALRHEIDWALRRLGIADCFRAVVSAEDTERSKPDPEGYLLALDALRACRGEDLEAAHCLVIEDTPAGVQAAKSAGMWVVGVTHTLDEPTLRRAGADVVVDAVGRLDPATVESLFRPEVSP